MMQQQLFSKWKLRWCSQMLQQQILLLIRENERAISEPRDTQWLSYVGFVAQSGCQTL